MWYCGELFVVLCGCVGLCNVVNGYLIFVFIVLFWNVFGKINGFGGDCGFLDFFFYGWILVDEFLFCWSDLDEGGCFFEECIFVLM